MKFSSNKLLRETVREGERVKERKLNLQLIKVATFSSLDLNHHQVIWTTKFVKKKYNSEKEV